MTHITRKLFILETLSYTAVIVQEMAELSTFCDKSIKLCMISTRHVTNNSETYSYVCPEITNLKKRLIIIFLLRTVSTN